MTTPRAKRTFQVITALIVVLVCGTIGAGIGVANWVHKDLPSTGSLQTIAPPVKTLAPTLWPTE